MMCVSSCVSTGVDGEAMIVRLYLGYAYPAKKLPSLAAPLIVGPCLVSSFRVGNMTARIGDWSLIPSASLILGSRAVVWECNRFMEFVSMP